MVSLDDIKSDFPDWPDDVIEQWLLKFANQSGMGWPPPDPMTGHRWELLLTHPITWWKGVAWTQETRDCSFDKLSIDARKTMNSMYKLRMEPDGGTTNIRNVKSKHWIRWLGAENRCVVPFNSFSEFNKAEGGDIYTASAKRESVKKASWPLRSR
jgi:hypothetical protein